MRTDMTDRSYTCGVIEESLASSALLEQLRTYLVRSRTEAMPNEGPAEWHVNEYLIPGGELAKLLPELERHVRKGWYIHAFNIEEKALIVILHGKSFRLPLVRDSSWDQMIQYGKTVQCETKWTENIPLRV